MPTADEQFSLLLKYIHEEVQLKDVILNDLLLKVGELTGEQKIEHFVTEMAKATSAAVLHKAIWLGLQRESLDELANAYRSRFERAALHSGKPYDEINNKFIETLLAPWHSDKELKEYISAVEAAHVKAITDKTRLHLQEITNTAMEFESMAYNRSVTRLEKLGPKKGQQSGRNGASTSGTAGGAQGSVAERMGLPTKQVRGRVYYACIKCFAMTGKHEWHPPNACPFHGVAAGKSEASGKAMMGNAGTKYVDNVACFKCGDKGHFADHCKVEHQTEAGRVAQKAFNEKRRQRREQSKGGQVRLADGDNSSPETESGVSAAAFAALTEQVKALTDSLQKKSPGEGGSFAGLSAASPLWFPTDCPEDGFMFGDSYSSDEGGTGLLGAAHVKQPTSRKLVPAGMVPAGPLQSALTGAGAPRRSTRVRFAATPLSAPVPSSARRQARMYDGRHDEGRAERSRLPAGMVNPADVVLDQVPAPPEMVRPVGSNEDSSLQIREAQLVSLLRTALKHLKFPNLPVELITDHSAEGEEAWQRARLAALSGELHDGQDARSIAWQTAMQRAINLFVAQAQLQARDLATLDFRAIYRAAIMREYGAEVADQLPSVLAGLLSTGLPDSELPDGALRCFAQPSDDEQAALEEHRSKRVEWINDRVKWTGRRPVAILDGSKIPLTINGQRVLHVVLDGGANEPMLNRRLVDAQQLQTNAYGKNITGVNGKPTMMPRTISEMQVELYLGDAQREAIAKDQMMVMTGDTLPDALLDNEMMAHLGISVNPVTWVATYQPRPYDPTSEPVAFQLFQPTAQQMAALAELSVHRHDSEAAQELDTVEGFCFAAMGSAGRRTHIPVMEVNSDDEEIPNSAPNSSQVGGGEGMDTCFALGSQVWGGDSHVSHVTHSSEAALDQIFPSDMPYREVYLPLCAALYVEDEAPETTGPTVLLGQQQYTQQDLDDVPSLPHTDPSKVFVLDLAAMQGHRFGGLSALYCCAGVLTSMVMDVVNGAHLAKARVLERNPRRRAQAEKVVRQLQSHFPDRVPLSAVKDIFSWADDIDHDAYQLDGSRLLREFGADCELVVRIEAGCQGHSALGPKNGFNHPESGGLVAIAKALSDLQYGMARKRGIRRWHDAPAQFGYVMENVPGPCSDSMHSELTRMASKFMDRVFGTPVHHEPALCGDLVSRHAKWWTNMFTTEFYEAHEPLFRCAPEASLSQVVKELTGRQLKPQTVKTKRQLMGGLNIMGQDARVLSKFVSSPSTVNQRMAPDGTPGAGMLEVVDSCPPRYVPCPAHVRIALQRFWAPQMECLAGNTEQELVKVVGNVCAPTSCSVMVRMAVGYSAWIRQQSELLHYLPSEAAPMTDKQVQDSTARFQRALDRAAADELTAVSALEREYAMDAAAATAERTLEKSATRPGAVTLSLLQAKQAKAKGDAKLLKAKAAKVAKARRAAASKLNSAQRTVRQQVKQLSHSSVRRNVLNALLMLLMVAASWGPAAYSAARRAGSLSGTAVDYATEAGFYQPNNMTVEGNALLGELLPQDTGQESQHAWMDFVTRNAAAMDDRYRDAAMPGQCLYEMANLKATGKTGDIMHVPSLLLSAKDGSKHEWQMGADFKAKAAFAAMMDSNPDWYAWGLNDLREVKGAEYSIELTDKRPIFAKQYHLAHRESEFAESWVKELEEAGLVKEIVSPYAAPVVVAPKKDETGKWNDLRYAIDYRRLNAVTVRDQYPTPVPEEILAKMKGASLFTSMDAQKAFHQVKVAEDTQPLLSFHSGNRLMTWNRMPFGGKNSVACWQRCVDEALAGIGFAQAFADDVVVWSDGNETEHIRRVQVVMERLHSKGIQISPKKTKLGMKRLEFLGHVVSSEGVEPQWDKVEAIAKLPRPTTASEVRSFIGMATYYCKFLDHYSHVKRPLTELTKKDAAWVWGEAQEAAFVQIKDMLMSTPVLRNPDWTRPFILHTDWSKAGVGACLSQIAEDGKEYAVAFASRMNSRAESTFSSYEGEVSAVVYAIQRFRYYLWGKPFKLITDCKAMEWLTTTAKLRSKLARWSLILAEYDMDIVHRAGKDNTVPDLLSRQPSGQPQPGSGTPSGAAFHLARRPQLPMEAAAFMSQQWAAPVAAGFLAGLVKEVSYVRFDPWTDAESLQFIKGELPQQVVSQQRWEQLHRRCSRYQLQDGRIWYRTVAGTLLEIPPPDQRRAIIMRVHQENGHLGRDRTHAMVAQRYTWPRLFQSVAEALKTCSQCDRVRSSFNRQMDVMQPLPLMGLFYRFHLDAAVNLPASTSGHMHVLIIVDAFSKWIDLVPLTELTASAVAAAFEERVLARFGRPVEVTTDNGSEYKAEFHRLCQDLGIEHRTITAGHPEANGLAERIVQVMKKALRKYVLAHGVGNWPSQLPTIEFGYRTTPQRSTGFSPYFLVYGRHPVYPEQVRALLDGGAFDVEDENMMYKLITERAAVLRDAMPLAYERAVSEQRKQAIRFQRVRQRDLPPRQHRFRVGEYVYVSQRPVNTLDVRTSRRILRVRSIRPQGVLELEGADGQTVRVRMELCAPCRIPNLVTSSDGVAADLECSICGSPSMADPMLLCDRCDRGYHIHCLTPPLEAVPSGPWCCPQCQPSLTLGPQSPGLQQLPRTGDSI